MMISSVLAVFLLIGFSHGQLDTQVNLNKMAAGLKITYKVTSNTKDISLFHVSIILQNNAEDDVILRGNGTGSAWELHFDHVFMLMPSLMGIGGDKTIELEGQGVNLSHVQGSHFFLSPTKDFPELTFGRSKTIKMIGKLWSASRTDVMPNWFLAVNGLKATVVANTAGETLSFAAMLNKPSLWKRYNFDLYNPYSPQERYERHYTKSFYDPSTIRIIPKPLRMTMHNVDGALELIPITNSWTIVYDTELQSVANFLKQSLKLTNGIALKGSYTGSDTNVIRLSINANLSVTPVVANGTLYVPETYTFSSSATSQSISIVGKTDKGAFYGAITLINLLDSERRVPQCSIEDGPRFEYRGFMIDVSRNFHTKAEILRFLRLMGRYKLNKLHLHLSDDEGWRLDIPKLPELTSLGSKRCYDTTEKKCLLPQVGSGPNSEAPGSGFYSQAEYKEILTEAVKQHVEIIPEFDMPGHARAAIKAMELRMEQLSKTGPVPATNDVTLTEAGDPSVYTTPQSFTDNAMNPCLDSTFNFIEIVVDSVIELHKDIQPLKMFHFGMDEVGKGAWVNSTRCQAMIKQGLLPEDSPKYHFFQKSTKMASDKGVTVGAWEDGLMWQGNTAFDLRMDPAYPDVYAYSWDNIWEWGVASRTYRLANGGYKVVMSHGSHLYFDHPYEPDPEERGYYWATRFTDTKKTFAYNGRDFYSNIESRLSGLPISDEEKCKDPENCIPLTKPENIVGMQACLFSETTRTKEQLHDRFFPRGLAMAERAWHEATWESEPKGDTKTQLLADDWASFVQAVGYRELLKLESESVNYRIPPPGAKLSFGRLLTSALFPALVVEYSLDFGQTWTDAGPLVYLGDYVYPIYLRTRSVDKARYSRTVIMYPDIPVAVTAQPTVTYIANNLDVYWKVEDNYETYGNLYYAASLTLTNNGDTVIPVGNWAIYITVPRWIEQEYAKLEGKRYVNYSTNMYIEHVQGYQFKFGPTKAFTGLESKKAIIMNFRVEAWSVSRSDSMPNWYVTAPGMTATNLVNTKSEDLTFAAPFTKTNQYKRATTDLYSPWTPATRYDRNKELNPTSASINPILPTPNKITKTSGMVDITSTNGWTILYSVDNLKTMADYFKETMLKFVVNAKLTVSSTSGGTASARNIQLKIGLLTASTNTNAYKVTVDVTKNMITVQSPSTDGLFSGVISLIQLATQPSNYGKIMGCEIIDWPRYDYRGMQIDVARNFVPKEEILKILDVMALYKLNKFHFHLTDDEGWRLEIPGLPKLTDLGSNRCHDLEETECVMSTLGSGANSDNNGSGYYSVADYKEILNYATVRHIEVIPEFDMPGHGHAAIKAMRARRTTLMEAGKTSDEAIDYILDDLNDPSQYFSIQMYDDNAINPCITSTYKFIAKIIQEIKAMHKDIQPLKVFHFGGDEVAHGSWQDSPSCQSLLGQGLNLKEEFTKRVSNLTSDLILGAWEDGLMETADPWNITQLVNKEVIAYIWNNIWEWGAGRRAYQLANAGYKVVLTPVTHLYFDHPNEPSPEERGFYWGPRYTDIFKSFGFMPDNYYDNIDVSRMGAKLNVTKICATYNGEGCPKLMKPENIIGIQGALWSETIRLPEQLDYMIFPRMLALAERAWHKASWEGKAVAQRVPEMTADKAKFAQSIGSVHLPLLEKLGVKYRIPPPGAKQSGKRLIANVEFPGLPIMYKDSQSNWRVYTNGTSFTNSQNVYLRTQSHDGNRTSTEISVRVIITENSGSYKLNFSCVSILLTLCVSFMCSKFL